MVAKVHGANSLLGSCLLRIKENPLKLCGRVKLLKGTSSFYSFFYCTNILIIILIIILIMRGIWRQRSYLKPTTVWQKRKFTVLMKLVDELRLKALLALLGENLKDVNSYVWPMERRVMWQRVNNTSKGSVTNWNTFLKNRTRLVRINRYIINKSLTPFHNAH